MLFSTTNTEDTISEIPRVMQSGVIDHKQIWPFSWNPSVVGGFMTLFLSIRRRKMVAEWLSKSWVLLGFCKQRYIQRTLLTCGEEIAKNRRPTKDLTFVRRETRIGCLLLSLPLPHLHRSKMILYLALFPFWTDPYLWQLFPKIPHKRCHSSVYLMTMMRASFW